MSALFLCWSFCRSLVIAAALQGNKWQVDPYGGETYREVAVKTFDEGREPSMM